MFFQVLERTEKLMRKAIVSYREDLDLENVIDFVQKKVNYTDNHSQSGSDGSVGRSMVPALK